MLHEIICSYSNHNDFFTILKMFNIHKYNITGCHVAFGVPHREIPKVEA